MPRHPKKRVGFLDRKIGQRLVATDPVATADAESTTATGPPASPPEEAEEAAPAAPSRPVSEESLLGILREVEAKVVKLIAAAGRQASVMSSGAASSCDEGLGHSHAARHAADYCRQEHRVLSNRRASRSSL